jgi:transposase
MSLTNADNVSSQPLSFLAAICCIIKLPNTAKRVVGRLEAERGAGRFDGLEAIGIDETSHRRGHRYLTIVVNHVNGEVVWAGEGHGKKVLDGFFDLLSDAQRAAILLVSADGARWIADVVADRCPNAVRLMDPFHVVSWATGALDEVRRRVTADARRAGHAKERRGPGRPKKGEGPPPSKAGAVKGARYALLKNPEDLHDGQMAQLEMVRLMSPELHRAYMLKEQLRLIFHLGPDGAEGRVRKWLSWAQRCRIPEFVELGRKVRRHRGAILDAIRHSLSNARIEAVNNKVKVVIRVAYGFRNIESLISLIMLRCTSLPILLPWQTAS